MTVRPTTTDATFDAPYLAPLVLDLSTLLGEENGILSVTFQDVPSHTVFPAPNLSVVISADRRSATILPLEGWNPDLLAEGTPFGVIRVTTFFDAPYTFSLTAPQRLEGYTDVVSEDADVTGGTGSDTVVLDLDRLVSSESVTRIQDFVRGEDRIQLVSDTRDLGQTVLHDIATEEPGFIRPSGVTFVTWEFAPLDDSGVTGMLVTIDVDGDSDVDHHVQLIGVTSLDASDFLVPSLL